MSIIKLKRYVLMGGLVYYASGGFQDYIDSYDERIKAEEEMRRWLEDKGIYHWAHIGDLETGEITGIGQACNPMGLLR